MMYASVRRQALLPVLLGLAAAVLVLQGGSAFVKDPVDPVARELVCTEDTPQVCVARVHSGVLGEVTPPARAALARLARLPDAPARAVEHLDRESRVIDQPADALLIPLAIGDDGHAMDVDRLESIMLGNVGVVPFVCPDDLPGTDRAVAEAATSWVTGVEPSAETPGARKLWDGLRKLDERDAAARVSAVRRSLLTCRSGAGLLDPPQR